MHTRKSLTDAELAEARASLEKLLAAIAAGDIEARPETVHRLEGAMLALTLVWKGTGRPDSKTLIRFGGIASASHWA